MLLTKIKSLTTVWSLRSLSIIGKILVVNTLLVSQFVYKMLSTYLPTQEFLKEFRKIITKFIWDNKKPKIAYNKLIQTYQNGGLKLVDLELKYISLKVAWIDRILYSGADLVFLKVLLPLDSPMIWYCNIKPQDVTVVSTSIARDTWKAWAAFNYHQPVSA